MVTVDQRLSSIEEDINRIMEKLQEAATVNDGSEYNTRNEELLNDVVNRLQRVEERLDALIYKHNIVAKGNDQEQGQNLD
jgi:hypothetical protein